MKQDSTKTPRGEQLLIYEGKGPTSVKVVSVLGIVVGLLGLCMFGYVILFTATKFNPGFLLFCLLFAGMCVFGVYSLLLTKTECLLFYDDRLEYKAGRTTRNIDYKDIQTVFILRRTHGRGFDRDYLIIPLAGCDTTTVLRRQLIKYSYQRSEIQPFQQHGHLVYILKNQTEKEFLVGFLREKVTVVHEGEVRMSNL